MVFGIGNIKYREMKFAKQKVLIVLMLFALPHVFILALIETPELSSWVLNVALKMTRLRTGLKVDATGWEVNPVTFSAKIEGVRLTQDEMSFYAPRVQVWISPVALLLGRIHFNVAEIANAEIEIKNRVLPNKEEDTDKTTKKFLGKFSRSYPKVLGEKIENFIQDLSERNISFDDAELASLRLKTGDLLIDDLNLELNNLQQGQARLEWKITGLRAEGRFDRIKEFSGTISLLKASEETYQVYIGQIALALDDYNSIPTFKLRGAWPGQVVVDVRDDWNRINDFLKFSPDFKSIAFKGKNSGSIDLQLTARMLEKQIEWFQVDAQTNKLIFEDNHLNDLKFSARLNSGEKDWDLAVKTFEMKLPGGPGVKNEWANSLSLKSMTRSENEVDAKLSLNQASLCGIMLAAGDPECQVGIAITGGLALRGSLEPLSLKVLPDFKLEEGPILDDPYVKGGEVVVNLKPGTLKGKILVNDRRMIFEELQINWDNIDPVEVRGDVVFSPTKVNLRASVESGSFDNMFYDLAGLRFGGHAKIESDIFYDHSLPKEKRTMVNAFVRSKNFSFEDQDLGTLSGPIKFADKKLSLGPFQLRNGGGSGVVHGSLSPTESRGSYLSLVSIFSRFEYTSYLDEKKQSEAFRGFVSGRAILEGHVNSELNPETGLKGEITLQAKNLKAFDIPFDSAKLNASYINGDLKVNELEASKDDATLKMKGFLSEKGGSELTFESQPIAMSGIEIEPKLSLFEKGRVAIDGFWRPSEGWGVNGVITNATIAGAKLGDGRAILRGDSKKLLIQLKWPELDMDYVGKYVHDDIIIDSLQVKLKDQGIYAGFAYLGDWVNPKAVDAKGELSFLWTPQSGFFKTKNLIINAPNSSESKADQLLNVQGSQELVWENRKVKHNSISWKEGSQLKIDAASGEDSLGIGANLSLGLFRLFVPELDARVGQIVVNGRVPLSPHFATLRLGGEIKGGILKIPEITGELENFNAKFDMQRSQIDLDSATATAGNGKVTFRGVYKVDFDNPAADILISLNQADLVLLEDVPGTYTGEIQIRGDHLPYLMSGRVSVAEALYTKEFGGENQEAIAKEVEPSLQFNLDATIMPDSEIRNSVVSSGISGNLILLGNSNEPLVKGDLLLNNGTIHANQVDFKIIQSRIQFYGEKDNVPIVSLRAGTSITYGSTDYRIEMNARGPGDSLAIDFSSDPPLPKRDIVSLLAFGVIRQDDNLGEENDDLITAAQAEAFQTIFGQAIGNSLSKNTGFDVRLKASTSNAGRADNVPKVSVMRRLSDRVTARYARSLDVNNPEKDLQVDYQLLNNVNLSGVWESPTPEESSLGVDLRFRFEIE